MNVPTLFYFFAMLLALTFHAPSIVQAKSGRDNVKSESNKFEIEDDDDDRQSESERDAKKKCLKTIYKQTKALYKNVRSKCSRGTQSSPACIQAKAELEIKKAAYQDQAKACLSGTPVPTEPPPVVDCQFNGQKIANGQSVNAFQASSVPFGQTCVSQSRTCTNGVLAGAYQFAACTVAPAPIPIPIPTPTPTPTPSPSPAPAASCQFNGQTIASGNSLNAFQASSVPFGQTCSSQARTCTNGVLSGTYQFASCTVAAAASCQFNGQTIVSGQSVNAFQAASVPFATTCTSQSRTCTNGTLSGSYTFATCTVAANPPIDGARLYTQNCAGCHGALASSSKSGKSAASITSAIQNVGSMKSNANLMSLTPAEIEAIAKALGN